VASQGREDELLHLQSTLLRSAEAVATTEQAPTSSWVASDIAVGSLRALQSASQAAAGRSASQQQLSENIIGRQDKTRQTCAFSAHNTLPTSSSLGGCS